MSTERSLPIARDKYHNNARLDILHLVPENPGRILDVGGGTGATSALIKEKCGAEYAIVVDGADVKPEIGIDLLLQGNLDDDALWERLQSEHDGFDTILCLDVLEHLVDPWSVVKRCSDMLREGGCLIVSLPNARNYSLTFPLFFLGRFELHENGVRDRTHLRWFVKSTAEKLVTCGGLQLESSKGGWYLNRSTRWERLAKLGFAPGFLFQIYYLKAVKANGAKAG